MTPEFNAWWYNSDEYTNNHYESESAAFWAWEGWKAGHKSASSVIPEKRSLPEREGSTYFRALGWNECIDAIGSAQHNTQWVSLTDAEMRELEKEFNAERVRTSDEEYLVIYPSDYWAWQRAFEKRLQEKNGR
jgi:hypothetical protein